MSSPLVPTPSEIQYQLAHIHDDRASRIVISHVTCLPLAAIAVTLRLLSRRLSKSGRIKVDDLVIIAALIFATGQVILGLLCVRYGGAKHAILLKQPQTFGKLVLADELIYNPAIASVKISILLMYRQLFPHPRFRIALWALGSFITLYCLVSFTLLLFQCRPIQGAWNPAVRSTCIQFNAMFVVMGSLNVVTDIATLCLPMPLLWRLQISTERKLQLIGMFMVGGFICVVSIVRVPKMFEISLSDASWSNVEPCVWSVVEVCVAIVCACLPTYRPLFDPKVRRNKNETSMVEIVDMDRKTFSMAAAFGKGDHGTECRDVELLHYRSCTTNQRQLEFDSPRADARDDIFTVIDNKWHAQSY